MEQNLLASDKPIYRTYEDYKIEDLLLYAGLDCITTSELASTLAPKCEEEPSYIRCVNNTTKVSSKAMSIFDSYEKFTTPAFDFILDLEINGIKYDVEGNRRMAARMVEEVATLEEEIFTELGSRINLDSGVVMSDFLYVEKGFEVASRTKTGEPSTDGDALIALADKYELPWLRTIGKRKDIVSIYRTFIENYVKDFVKRDGRLHPSYNLHGTSSFRISGDSPNLTQISRPKHGYNIRDLYIVDSGNIFLALDYSSAEVVCLANLSGDPKMLEAISQGLDFHSYSASQMYGIPYQDFKDAVDNKDNPKHKEYKGYRQASKALGFGILYGSSAGGIAMNLGISFVEADRLITLYFSSFPKIKEYVENSHKMAIWNHMSVSSFGQRKMQYGTLPCFENTAVWNAALRNSQNFGCQNPTSSLGLSSFSAVNSRIKKYGAKCICTIYDSLEIEVPIENAAKVLEIAFETMVDIPPTQFSWMTIPIRADAEIGTSWGNAGHIRRGATQEDINNLFKNEFK